MHELSKIGTVVLLGLFAILSLSVAARGHQDLAYWGGLGFFVFCILLAFYGIARLTVHPSEGRDPH
ncbi:MAG: hypothetical protein JNN33_18770 [Rhodospirillaceae bacterium]|jgi:hypothetical protein|nr:hypothetical protein [Rhodospirillaceae bacterium]